MLKRCLVSELRRGARLYEWVVCPYVGHLKADRKKCTFEMKKCINIMIFIRSGANFGSNYDMASAVDEISRVDLGSGVKKAVTQ